MYRAGTASSSGTGQPQGIDSPHASQEAASAAAQIAHMPRIAHLPVALTPGPLRSPQELDHGASPASSNHITSPTTEFGVSPASSINRQTSFANYAETAKESTSAISLLQEFIQCSREFRNPAKRSILHWRFDERLADAITLEFRATVAFLLDGVAHHAVGDWRTSKKLARLDVAERALILFVSLWGQQLLKPETWTSDRMPQELAAPTFASLHTGHCPVAHAVREVQDLEDYCRCMPVAGAIVPRWSVSWDGNFCQVTAELILMDVPHMLQGPAMLSEEEAYAETAKRILWYLQCPGYEDDFEPDPRAPAAIAPEIPAPPKNWNTDEHLQESAAQVERKTALVRVQNRVQQAYARLLKPGQRVWEWSYENESPAGHGRCKATVRIPVAGKEFVGDWQKVQRDAQFDVCAQVAAFLDGLEGSQGTKS